MNVYMINADGTVTTVSSSMDLTEPHKRAIKAKASRETPLPKVHPQAVIKDWMKEQKALGY